MKHCFYAVLSAVLFISCVNEKLENITDNQPVTEAVASDVDSAFVPGEAYVRFSDEMVGLIEADLSAGAVRTKSSDLNAALDALGITGMRRLFPHAGEYEPRTRKEGLHRWYIVEYSENVPHTKAADSFLAVAGVEHIEPIRRIRTQEFNDLGADLWGLYNRTYAGYDINVLPVWENYTVGNPDVIVAVVDSGVDINHEDLKANCLPAEYHYDAVTNAFGATRITAEEHGTHVAGTIAAVSNNGKGIAGIAGGDSANGKSGVKIMSCQIFKGDKNGSAAAAIKAGADKGAVISQNSWGYIYNQDGQGALTPDEKKVADASVVSQADKEAIDYFIKYAGCDNDGNQKPDSPMKGGVVIFASGNDGYTNAAPGNYAPVIAVGAIDQNGKRADYSNYGDWVDIAAPGTDIYSTVPGNTIEKMKGTSMACPHVSGVAALIVSHFGGVGFTREMLEEALLEGANKELVSASSKIGGLVDAYSSFRYFDGKDAIADPVTDLTAAGDRNMINLKWTTPKDSNEEAAYGFMVIYDTDKADVEAATPESLAAVKYLTVVPGTAVGTEVNYTISKLEFETTYYVKVISYSFGRKYAEPSSVEEVSTEANNAPVITTSYEGSYDLKAFQTITIPIAVSEPDGHEMTFTYRNGSAADSFKALPDNKLQITVVGKAADAGTYTAVVTATDEYGLASSMDFRYTILPNNAPEKIKEMDNVLLTAKGQDFTLDMKDYVRDADGEDLKYEVTISNPNVLHIVVKRGTLLATALGYGITDVEIKAKDAREEVAVFNFKVQVKDPSSPLSVYPNPVTDFLNIGTLDAAETHIKIVSQTGKTVYDETSTVSGYEPARIDMTSCAPGMYALTVTFGGNEYKQNIVKL